MGSPTGFQFKERASGEIAITHHGQQTTVLRGEKARKFLRQIELRDPQEVMARVTGNYKRGNERRK